MLSELLQHVQKLTLPELRELHRNVCNAIRGAHQDNKTKVASKFEPNSRVLYAGRIYLVEGVGARHVFTKCGCSIPMSQCRVMSKF